MKPTVFEKLEKLLQGDYICDNCLGRQFAQLLEGYSNDQRGKILRTFFSMHLDAKEDIEKYEQNVLRNFHSENLKKLKLPEKQKKCFVCDNFFENIDKIIKKIKNKTKNTEFNTFLVGTKLDHSLLSKEESLWESIGIDYCEPLKAEINREVGRRLEEIFNKKADLKRPDINIIINLIENKIIIEKNPLFIYGEYQKLRRGIPQTKWPDKRYKTSVEELMAKTILEKTKGKYHKLHGCGREDVDAKCLGWRPFVFEVLEPEKRNIDLKKIQKKINKLKSIQVKNLCFSDIRQVRELKNRKNKKTYRALVECEIKKPELKKLSKLKTKISQKTPTRVLHRRSDLLRKRKVYSIKGKYKNKNHFYLEVTAEAGTYIKELISGDDGRTKPSVAGILGKKAVCKELDVTKIW